MKITLTAAAALLALSTPLMAQENMRAGLGVTSLGATVEGQYRINENWAVRGLYSGGLSYDDSGTEVESDVTATYSGSGNLGGAAILMDYYVGGSGFKISGGLLMSTTGLDLSSNLSPTGNGSFDFGDLDITAGSIDVDASAEFKRSMAPMITLGYDWQITDRFSLNAEVGAIAIGGFDIDMTATPDQDAINAGFDQAAIDAEIDAEIAKAQDDIGNSADLYPFIGIMGTWRF